MSVIVYIFVSVIIVSLLSLIGAIFLVFGRKIKNVLLELVSFSAGALFANALLHLLPDAFEESSQLLVGIMSCLGILVFFTLEKFIHWHHHCHGDLMHNGMEIKPLGVTSLIGDLLHNMIDGAAIAASYFFSVSLGLSTTIAVISHEIPKEISNFGVLVHAGFSTSSALFYNFLSALGAVVGALAVILLQEHFVNVKYFLVPFTAGSFLYIAGTDLLPELLRSKSVREIIRHAAWMALGMGVMVALLFFNGHHHHH